MFKPRTMYKYHVPDVPYPYLFVVDEHTILEYVGREGIWQSVGRDRWRFTEPGDGNYSDDNEVWLEVIPDEP